MRDARDTRVLGVARHTPVITANMRAILDTYQTVLLDMQRNKFDCICDYNQEVLVYWCWEVCQVLWRVYLRAKSPGAVLFISFSLFRGYYNQKPGRIDFYSNLVFREIRVFRIIDF